MTYHLGKQKVPRGWAWKEGSGNNGKPLVAFSYRDMSSAFWRKGYGGSRI